MDSSHSRRDFLKLCFGDCWIGGPYGPGRNWHSGSRSARVRIGAGRQLAEGIADPLVEVVMDDLAVDISLFIDGAFHRVAGLASDLRVAMNVSRTESDILQLVVEGITVENTEQIYNEIAPGADLSGLFDSWSILQFKLPLVISLHSNWILPTHWEKRWAPITLNINTVRRDLGTDGAHTCPRMRRYVQMQTFSMKPIQLAIFLQPLQSMKNRQRRHSGETPHVGSNVCFKGHSKLGRSATSRDS